MRFKGLGWVIIMMAKVWTSINNKRPSGKKLYKVLGISSGLIWVVALGSVFLLKDKKLTTAIMAKVHHEKPAEHSEHHSADQNVDSHKLAEHNANPHKAEGHESAEKKSEPEVANLNSDLPSETECEALKQIAELQVEAGNFEKAVAPLKRLLTIPTKDPELLTLATHVFLGVGRYADALKTACEAIVLKPDDIDLKVKAIEATYRLGNVEKAFEMAKATLKDHPKDLGLLIQTATMEIEMGKPFPEYGKSLATAAKLDPDFPATLYLQGRKSQLEGNYRDAEIAFQKLLKQEPKNAKAHGQLGMALYHMGKNSDAQFEFESELALNPDDYNTWFNLGELQLISANNGQDPIKIQALRAQSLKCFLKAIELNADHAQAHYRVGVIMNGNGQYKEAVKHLEAAYKIDDTHVPTLVQLSIAYEYLKRLEQAKECLTKAYELDPLNKVVLFKLKPWS